VPVVPALAAIRNGVRPASLSSSIIVSKASGRRRNCSSVGTDRTFLSGKPARMAPLATEWWAWSEV
jgi:hypothetical protein